MSINHLNIQNKQTGDKLSAAEFNSTTSKINEVVDGVNASATGGKIGSNGTPLTKDSSGRIIIPLATSSSSGAMSASDKSKLDSINPSGAAGDYVDSISNEANYTANDMYDTTSEFYGTNHKINTRSISYTTSDGSTHTFTHLDTVYKVATPSTTAGGTTISGKAGLMSAQDKQKLDMMPRPSDITSALSGKADKQIVVLVTRTQQGSTDVYSASKTFTEISTAIGNGTNVILQYNENYYHLSYSTRDYIVFTRFVDDYYMYSSIEVNSHDEWSYSSFILQEELTIDSTPTSGSSNPISSGGVYNALRSNFKTVNGVQLLGSGNIQTQFFINFEQVNGEWSCDWEFSDMKNTYIAGATLRGLIELDGNSYFSDVSEARNNFMRFTWIIPSESGSAPYSIYNQNLLVLEAQEISTGEDMVTTVIYQRFNKPLLTPTDLRAVAFSGSYSDLSDTPTFKTINGNSIVGSGNIDADDVVHGALRGSDFVEGDWINEGGTWTYSIPLSGGVITPDENKIYVDVVTNKIYRWKGSYVQIGGGEIKTINGESLVGSGNITLDTETVNYDGDGNTYFAAGDSLTEGLDSMADAIDNINPNEISSITATESTASGGNNVVTITETNGTVTSFNVKNGIDGADGQDGADGVSLGEVALVQTTGDSEESVMSQKAVTDELIFPDITITESDFDDWKENYYFTTTGKVYSSTYACNEKFVDIRNYDKVSFSGQNVGIFHVILYNEKGEFLSNITTSSGATYTRSVYPKMAYFRIYTTKTVYQSAMFTFTLSEGHSTREEVADVKRSDIQVLHTAFQCNQDKTVKVYEGVRMVNKTIVIFANAFNSYIELTTGTIYIRYDEGWCNIYKNDSTSTTLCRFSQNRGTTKQSISMILTFDDTGNMKVYLNGILKASCTYDNLPDDGWDIYLGRQIMSHFSIINCALDDYLKVIERNGWMDWLPSLAWNQSAASISATTSKGGWIGGGYRVGALVHASIELTNNTSSAVSYSATNMYKYPSGNVSVAAGTTETVDCLIDVRNQASFGSFGSYNQANLSASAIGDYVVFEWGMDYRYCHNGGYYNLAGLKWEDVPSLGLLNQEMVKKVCEPEHTYSNTGSAVGQISVDSNGNIQMFNGTVWKQINNS